MEIDEHLVKYERERFRSITSTEEVAATAAGLGGLLGGLVTDVYLSGEVNNSEGGQADVTPTTLSHKPISIGHAIQLTPRTTAAPREVKTTAEVPTTSNHNKFMPLEYQAMGIIGVLALAAFSAAAISSGIRYAIHRRKINFKSDISPEELREWYANSSIDR